MRPDPFDFDRPTRYAVMGQPVAHSLSPRIHALFGDACGIRLTYEAIEVAPGGLAQAVSHFQALGGRGLNITVPLKLEAARLCRHLMPAAAQAGAANTLILDTDISGDNTDGVGLLRDLVRLKAHPAERRVLILGAGGAVRGILGPLAAARPARLVVYNRDEARARRLVEDLRASLDMPVEALAGSALEGAEFDLVLHATAAGLAGARPEVPSSIFAKGSFAYDLLYGPHARPFCDWARDCGAMVADGLGMLIEQAAESFWLWHGVRPDTGPVLQQLRTQPSGGAEVGIRA
ncbi:MAG TPA: shikimate dehydrogenase [Acidiferrobacteraceae bacterium]|nr:shikimate dehydrogenase [Acidiferrobacteraceae bacterium]